jgi:HAE1 family hydrophobic/amphiphilic exporter-1
LIDFCVRNPVKVAVGTILIVLFGALALWQMPMQLTPEVRIPTVSVRVRWPGASPYEVEHEIIQELEQQLKDVKGVVRMNSWSRYSTGRVTMEFAIGNDISESLLEINSRLHQVRDYPEDAWEPMISSSNLSDRPICWFVLSPQVPTRDEIEEFIETHPDLSAECQPLLDVHKWDLLLYRLNTLSKEHPELRALLPVSDVSKMRRFVEDTIEARFDRVPGVADAYLLGGEEEELQVIVDPQQLAARRLTIDDLRRSLRTRNKDTSGGEVWEQKRTYIVRTLGQFSNIEEVRNTIVAKQDGTTVHVKDVAEVRRGYKRPTESYRRGGSELIGIGVSGETGANVLDVVAQLRELTTELNEGTLAQRGVRLSEAWSDADYIHSAVGLVNQNIVIGGLLTIAVLLCFLRSVRSTLIIALAVPASVIATFLVLRILGRSLNVVSLAGLAFAVGMIVDNSVVVLENIYRHYQRGERPFAAAVRGTSEVWGAILAATLSTLAVFIPVLFNEEQSGQLFRDIALAISAAIGFSLLIAITVIPTAAARILPSRKRSSADASAQNASSGLSHRIAQSFVESVVGVNRWLQTSTLLRLAVVVVCIAASVFFSNLLFPHVEYLPRGNKNRIHCRLYPPPGYNVPQMKKISEDLFQRLRQYWEVHPDSPEAKELEKPLLKDLLVRAEQGNIMAQVQAEDPKRIRELLPFLKEVGSEFPGMNVSAYQLSLFPGSSRKIDLELSGPEMESLLPMARQIQADIKDAIPEAQTTAVPNLSIGNPELHVLPRWERAAELGVDATELGYLVDALVDGAYAAEYSIEGQKIDLRIIGSGGVTTRTQDLGSLPIATKTGIVPLSALADVEMSTGPPSIQHIERRRAMTIQVRPPDDMPLGEAIEILQAKVIRPLRDNKELGTGQHISLGGTADRLAEAWSAMRFNLLLAFAITYLLMAALFESWIYPLAIILSVPLAAVGGIAGLWLMNLVTEQPLDIITMLGFVILIGTSVNNAILIVHQTLNYVREDDLAPQQAILQSVRTRIRPIFMTTGTTVMGLFPLVVMPGEGSELYRGLGSVLLGGLLVSTLLTLILIPTFLSLMMDAQRTWQNFLNGSNESVFSSESMQPELDQGQPEREVVRPTGRDRR